MTDEVNSPEGWPELEERAVSDDRQAGPISADGVAADAEWYEAVHEARRVGALRKIARESTGKVPKWHGSRSYEPVFLSAIEGAAVERLSAEGEDEYRRSPAGWVYHRCDLAIGQSHVLRFDPHQFEALPRMDQREASEYLEQCRLPFDKLFIDLTAADGSCPKIGCTVTTVDADRPPLELSAVVVGFQVWETETTLSIVPWNRVSVDGGTYHEVLGCVISAPEKPEEGDTGPKIDGIPFLYEKSPDSVPTTITGAGFLFDDEHGERQALSEDHEGPGTRTAIWPAVPGETWLQPGERTWAERTLTLLTYACAQACAGILYFLESQNVEVVDGTPHLHRREQKRVAKRGWKVPLVVKVRRRKVRRSATVRAGGGTREFSHQFEVQGHYNHVTRGPHVRCSTCHGEEAVPEAPPCPTCKGTGVDPEKVTPCKRRDQNEVLTCPNGCRREWVPSYVKGPEDKPLVLKTREVT